MGAPRDERRQAAVVALVLPPVFKSTATILIEEQEIPSDFVITTVTSYVEQRLQSINQRIMSSTRLLQIIDRFDLYADERYKRTTEEIVEKMREDVLLEPISTEVVDKRTGRPTTASPIPAGIDKNKTLLSAPASVRRNSSIFIPASFT